MDRYKTIFNQGAAAGAFLIAGALCLCSVPVYAQEGGGAKAKMPVPTCPPSGYSRTYYGVNGDNDGIARAYKIASPCAPGIVRDAATALGFGRWEPLGIENVSSARFAADGQMAVSEGADTNGQLVPSEIVVDISYEIPAIRMEIQRQGDAQPAHEIQVFAGNKAWNEMQPGIGGTPSDALDRQVLIKLTPWGGFLSIIEAQGHVKIAKLANGDTTLTGESPYDHLPVTVTLDPRMCAPELTQTCDLPSKIEVTAFHKHYVGTFSGYNDAWDTGRGPADLFPFPTKINWTIDGRPYAQLTVTAEHSNAYVMFARPLPASDVVPGGVPNYLAPNIHGCHGFGCPTTAAQADAEADGAFADK